MIPFHQRIRQQFLYEGLYENARKDLFEGIELYRNECLREPTTHGDIENRALYQGGIYRRKFWLWMLDYTAGIDLDLLAPRLSEVVDEFVQWCEVEKVYNKALQDKYPEDKIDLNSAPVDFYNQLDYEDHLQLISVAIMLRDAQSVKRILRSMASYRGQDGLYEQIIADYAENPITDLDELFHEEYQVLLNVFYDQEPGQEQALLQQYLESWYKAQDGARWYNQHLKITDDNAWYYGYWAFEAGAVTYLLDLDDSTLNHMVYPRDLVAYGRKLRAEDRWTSREDDDLRAAASARLRGLPNEVVPKTGWWSTPALNAGAGRYFEQGQLFPPTKTSNYGNVIWDYDPTQQPPPPK